MSRPKRVNVKLHIPHENPAPHFVILFALLVTSAFAAEKARRSLSHVATSVSEWSSVHSLTLVATFDL